MELVYLWVEDYKNIHHQGFNFSPRFKCEYDEDTKELTIDENKDYVSIFPDNINITAIVGENGSGKSSIGEYLFYKEDRGVNKNYILIYHDNTLVIDSQNLLVNIKTNLDYVLSLKKISYNNEKIKIIFSFAEHQKPYNHNKASEKDNFIMLGSLHEINTYPIEKFNKLLEEFDFFTYKKASKNRQYTLDGVKYKALSFGEKSILSLCILIEKKIDDNKLNVLFLDEFTLSLHPNWERIVIKKLIEVFRDRNIHFIITSHSPFILSDIPKQNVVFLEKDENTLHCVNITETMKDFNTFGANIHTLLSHGFFMKDGLMGEFAREKINDVIKYLKKEDSTIQSDEEAKNIIDIIGEPILKNTLLTMYDEKKYSNESKLDKLNRKKLQLEKEIKELEEKSSEES